MARLQRLRGLLGLSIASGLAWIPFGIVISAAESLILGHPVAIGRLLADAPLFAAIGAVCGFAFGLALAAAERRRAFEALTLGRFVALGAAAAMIIPTAAILFSFGGFSARGMVFALAIFGVPGGLTAAALLTIARRAPPQIQKAAAPIAVEGS
jgi:hypothetical protein